MRLSNYKVVNFNNSLWVPICRGLTKNVCIEVVCKDCVFRDDGVIIETLLKLYKNTQIDNV